MNEISTRVGATFETNLKSYDLCVSNQQAHRQEGEVSEGNHRMPDLRLGPVRPHRQPHAGPSAPEDPEPRCRSAREEIRESAGRCLQE